MSPEMSGRPQREVADWEADLQDARQSMAMFSSWVNNADTKAGLLAATVAVVLARLSQQTVAIRRVITPDEVGEWGALIVLLVLSVAVGTAFVALAHTLIPRTFDDVESRFSFPHVAATKWTHKPASPREDVASEAWAQVATLARIVKSKFRFLKIATIATFVALPLFLVWSVVATPLPEQPPTKSETQAEGTP